MDCSTNVAVHIAVNILSATAAKTAILEVAFQVVAEAAITAVGEMTFIAAVTVIALLFFVTILLMLSRLQQQKNQQQ